MFKRYFCILLTLSLCVGCFTFVANAESSSTFSNYDSSGWFSVFDANPNRPRLDVGNTDLPNVDTFSWGFATRIFHVDALLFYNGLGTPDLYVSNGVSSTSYHMTTEYLGSYIYRFTGNVSLSNWNQLQTVLWITGSTPDTTYYATWLDVRVCTVSRSFQNVSFAFWGNVNRPNVGNLPFGDKNLIKGAPTDKYTVFSGDSGSYFEAFIEYGSRTFDFYDFGLTFKNVRIDSVSASYSGGALPVSVSFNANSSDSFVNTGFISVDARDMINYTGTFIIKISGQSFNDFDIAVVQAVGSVCVGENFTELTWLQRIWSQLQITGNSIATSITNALTDFFESADINVDLGISFDSGIDEIITSLGDVASNIINASGLDVSKITSAIGDAVSNINNSFGIDISEVTSTLTNGFNRLVDSTTVDWNNLVNQVGGFFNNLVDSIEIIFSIDKNVGDDFKDSLDSVIDLEHLLTDLPTHQNNGTGAFLVSDRNDSVGDVSEQLFQNGIVMFYNYAVPISSITVMFSYLTNHSAILTLLSVSLTLGLLAVILNIGIAIYRKKGD